MFSFEVRCCSPPNKQLLHSVESTVHVTVRKSTVWQLPLGKNTAVLLRTAFGRQVCTDGKLWKSKSTINQSNFSPVAWGPQPGQSSLSMWIYAAVSINIYHSHGSQFFMRASLILFQLWYLEYFPFCQGRKAGTCVGESIFLGKGEEGGNWWLAGPGVLLTDGQDYNFHASANLTT